MCTAPIKLEAYPENLLNLFHICKPPVPIQVPSKSCWAEVTSKLHSRVWWRCCGGFWFPGVCRVSTKEGICFGKKLMAPNVHFPYLFMKRLVNWSFGEMELTLQKGHYNGIFGWILVSQIHGGRSGACAMCPVPGKNRVCEWDRGLSGLPSFHVFRDRKDGSDKQILWFLIYHMLN